MKNTNLALIALVSVVGSTGCEIETTYTPVTPPPPVNPYNSLYEGEVDIAISPAPGFWTYAEDEYGDVYEANCYNDPYFNPSVELQGWVDPSAFCDHPSSGYGKANLGDLEFDRDYDPYYTTVNPAFSDRMVKSFTGAYGYMTCDLYLPGDYVPLDTTFDAIVDFPSNFIYEPDCDGRFRSATLIDASKIKLPKAKFTQRLSTTQDPEKRAKLEKLASVRKTFASLEEKEASINAFKTYLAKNQKAAEADEEAMASSGGESTGE